MADRPAQEAANPPFSFEFFLNDFAPAQLTSAEVEAIRAMEGGEA